MLESNAIIKNVNITRNKFNSRSNDIFEVNGGNLNVPFCKVMNNFGGHNFLVMFNLNFALINSVESAMNTIRFIWAFKCNKVTLSNNIVNAHYNIDGIVFDLESTSVTITNNTFIRNDNSVYIVTVRFSTTVTISNNKFIRNDYSYYIIDVVLSTVAINHTNFIENKFDIDVLHFKYSHTIIHDALMDKNGKKPQPMFLLIAMGMNNIQTE